MFLFSLEDERVNEENSVYLLDSLSVQIVLLMFLYIVLYNVVFSVLNEEFQYGIVLKCMVVGLQLREWYL